MTRRITFVSGNQSKIKEVMDILSPLNLTVVPAKIDLPEYQGDSDFICESKCKAAAELIDGPVIVEDTSLCFNALNGAPGPYIKWFYDKIGSDGLFKLLHGFDDKSASALCIFGYTEGRGKEVVLCRGQTKGFIVKPRGESGFGWDSCFLPENKDKTYAELTQEEKNSVSHRRLALNELKRHLIAMKNL